jgi:hypothetical protein
MTYIIVAIAGFQLPMALIVPRLTVTSGRQRIGQGNSSEDEIFQLCALYQTSLIVTLAILEGSAFAVTIAYLVQGVQWTLYIAAALVVGLVLLFPTRTRVEFWIYKQQDILNEGEQAGA